MDEAHAHDGDPVTSLEIERKYDIDSAASVPDWTALPGVVRVDDPEERDLDARYLDTADGALATSLMALRRRRGGPDAGWHLKRSTPEGKHETHWPLVDPDADDEPVPAAVADALSAVARGPFAPIARIRNARIAYALRDADGGLVAEFVDDRVVATDLRRGVETSWREWELELGPAAPADAAAREALFAAADRIVQGAGGAIAASGSKLARALGG